MARGNKFADFSIMTSKAAEADWAYNGECWMGGSSNSLVDESNFSLSGLSKDQNFLSASWSTMQKESGMIPASYDPPSSAQSDVIGGMDWTVEDKLSALLHNKFSLSDSVNAEAGSSVQSCKNHQMDFSELEWQTIGSLLPDDEDLFTSAPDMDGDVGAGYSGENEELDLFSSGGGLELESDSLDPSRWPKKNAEAGVGEHPYGEHPSRTLFVRNINSSVEDAELRVLFEQFGDIRTLYTACKHRGFVMISYYDIRAARSAMRALQNKALRRRKLDIHFSIPKDNPSDKDVNQGTLVVFNLDASVSNDELRQIFGVYGEVKEIRETPHKRHHKFIEFYDVRAAEAALRALNRCDIAGKRIKLEPSRPGGARRSLMQNSPLETEQEESPLFKEPTSPPLPKSAPVKFATTDSRLFEKDPLHEACHSLKYMGLGLHPLAPFVRTNSLSEFAVGTEPAHSSPSAAISAVKARMLSDHLLKMGAAGFNMVSSLESANGGGISTESLHPRSRESLPANGFLASSLNSLYQKESFSTLLPHSPARPSYGMNGFASHGEVRPYSHFLGGPMLSPNHHHVGSAPIAAFPILDRNQAYSKELFDVLSATGSLGAALGYHARHSMELSMASSLSSLPPGALLGSGLTDSGACPSSWSISRQQKGSSLTKTLRESVTSHPDWGLERGRSRKADNGVPLYDKKQYELDIERILRGEDSRTTLMIKNIPNKYTSKMLLAAIDEHHKGTYDFIYLPIDFKNKCNVGYAFINMTEPSRIIAFYQAFNGKRWEKFNSEKVASLAYARIQGKAALIAHFQNSSLMNEDKRCRPILFHSGGPNVGGQEPFPIGTNPRMRLSKGRGSHQGSPIGRY